MTKESNSYWKNWKKEDGTRHGLFHPKNKVDIMAVARQYLLNERTLF